MTNKNGLTEKQQGFIDDYLFSQDMKLRGNGTQCALKWFDIADNDENTAAVIANEYLRKPNIIAYKESKLAQISEEIDEKWIISEIKTVFKQSLEEKKYSDANKSLEMLGKWRALFTDRNINVEETIEDLIARNYPKGHDNKADVPEENKESEKIAQNEDV